eukprot:NODE_25896_length_572_cov_1.155056.p3 GENE.NODE_25896_length_572_cov_1.155056~~NODE_25896_length_572_cov_1.155056.p3  ORF type:complete len:54 (-),score=9.40 NODE_25896_length_572_cov_1.155056:314-475(-)
MCIKDSINAEYMGGLFPGQTFQAQIPDAAAAPVEAPAAATKKTKSRKPKKGCC